MMIQLVSAMDSCEAVFETPAVGQQWGPLTPRWHGADLPWCRADLPGATSGYKATAGGMDRRIEKYSWKHTSLINHFHYEF